MYMCVFLICMKNPASTSAQHLMSEFRKCELFYSLETSNLQIPFSWDRNTSLQLSSFPLLLVKGSYENHQVGKIWSESLVSHQGLPGEQSWETGPQVISQTRNTASAQLNLEERHSQGCFELSQENLHFFTARLLSASQSCLLSSSSLIYTLDTLSYSGIPNSLMYVVLSVVVAPSHPPPLSSFLLILSFLYGPTLTSICDCWKNQSFN